MERRFPLSESPFQHRRKKRRKRRRRTSRTPTEALFEERLTSAVETSWTYKTGNLCGEAVELFRWHAADYSMFFISLVPRVSGKRETL